MNTVVRIALEDLFHIVNNLDINLSENTVELTFNNGAVTAHLLPTKGTEIRTGELTVINSEHKTVFTQV